MNVHRLHQSPRVGEPDPLPLVRVPRRPAIAPPRFGIGAAFRVFRVRRWTILAIVFVCTAIVAIVLSQLTPLYSASALVVVGQQRTDKAAVIDPLATDPAVETQLRILQSSWLAERVIATLSLARDPEFNRESNSPLARLDPMNWFAGAKPKIRAGVAAQNPTALDPAMLNRFASHLTVAAEGRSSVARVTFTATNPVKAALIANTVVALYLQTQADRAKPAPAVSDEQLVRLTEQVREAEAAVERRKTEGPGAAAKDGNSLADEQLSELNAQITVARSNLAEREAKHRRAIALLSSGDDPATVTSITNAPVIVKLRGRQAELTRKEAELSVKYGDRHPRMIAIREERSNLQAKIDDELKRIVKGLAGAVSDAKTRVASLETSLGEMQAAANTPSASPAEGDDQADLRALEDELAARRTALEQYQSTVRPTVADAQSNDTRIIAKATAPQEPSFPDTPFIMGGTLFGSALFGMLFALVVENLGKGFRTGNEIERLAQVANLAVVPRLKGVKHIADRIMQKPSSSFSEAVRTLYSGLQLSSADRPPKVVVMTSSIPHEGKTSLAVSLGRLASKGGARVVLIDADLRHPSVGATFSPRRAEAGLVEVLTGKCKLREVLHRDPISPLEFIPTAAPPSNPSELLASLAMKNMIDILRQHYDLVIIDAAPVLPVSDTRLLSRIADKMVYVVGWNTTPREAVLAGLKLLQDANADIAGTVLNLADMRRHAIYSNGSASYGYDTKYTRYDAE